MLNAASAVNENQTFTAAWQCLVVFGKSAVLAQPTERALDDPAFGRHHEFVNRLLLNNLNDAAAACSAKPLPQVS